MLTVEILFVFGVVLVTLVLFFREVLPIPVTALLVAVTLMATGILTPEEGLSGFSSEATIAVLSMFALSAGITQTGVVEVVARRLVAWSGRSLRRQTMALALSGGPISGFINNTPLVAILIPVALRMAHAGGTSPSRLLIPLSNVAMLGGMLTVIGTSTNLLGNEFLAQMGHERFAFFEFTVVGAVALATGLAYYLLVGPYILPDRGRGEAVERFDLKGFLAEYLVPPDSGWIGRTLDDVRLTPRHGHQVARLFRGGKTIADPSPETRLQVGDELLVEGSREALQALDTVPALRPLPASTDPLGLLDEGSAPRIPRDDRPGHPDRPLVTAEVVVATGSRHIGKTVAELDLPARHDVQVVAVRHHGRVEIGPISHSRLRPGDILLVQGTSPALERLREQPHLFVTRERPWETHRTHRMPHALGIVGLVVLASASGLAPIAVAALAGALLMVIVGCLTIDEFLKSVHWDIILMLAGIIPLGLALEKTGAAALVATGLIGVGEHLPVLLFLMLLFAVVSVVTEVVSNNASVVLFVPIAIAAATGLGIDPRSAALTVIFAASTSMLTPIGYQTNTMVYAPGNYRFGDFARVGGPLNLILVVVIPATILWWFPA